MAAGGVRLDERDTSEIREGDPEWISSSASPATVVDPRAETSAEDSMDAADVHRALTDEEHAQRRRIARALGADFRLTLTLLAHIHTKDSVGVDELITQGPKDRLFARVFDLYDAGLIAREGSRVMASSMGKKILEKAKLT